MSVQESKSAADLFADDAAAHQYIQSRAKHLIDFLQIDDEAFYKKLPHLEHAEPYKYAHSLRLSTPMKFPISSLLSSSSALWPSKMNAHLCFQTSFLL